MFKVKARHVILGPRDFTTLRHVWSLLRVEREMLDNFHLAWTTGNNLFKRLVKLDDRWLVNFQHTNYDLVLIHGLYTINREDRYLVSFRVLEKHHFKVALVRRANDLTAEQTANIKELIDG